MSGRKKRPTQKAREMDVSKRRAPKSKKRNVARKSTSGGRGSSMRLPEEFSFYGVTPEPVDMSAISTRIKMGGMEITLTAKQVVEMMKLDPRVRVRDCRRSME